MALPLIELAPLILWVIAFALCIAVVYFAKAFFGVTGTVLGKLPIVGGWIDATAHKIENRISNVFGDLAARLEARIGASWHAAARLLDRLGHEIATHAALIATLAQFLPGVSLVANLYRALAAVAARVHSLVLRLEGIGHDLAGRIGHVERGIGADVLPRIRSLEREVARDLARERQRARTAERTAEHEIVNLRKWLLTHPWTAVTGAFVGSVAIALSRLGVDWIRCPTAKDFFKRRGCNAWRDLEALLLVGEAIGALSLVELAREEQRVVSAVARGVRDVLEV